MIFNGAWNILKVLEFSFAFINLILACYYIFKNTQYVNVCILFKDILPNILMDVIHLPYYSV